MTAPWTTTDRTTLDTLRSLGHTYGQIAQRLGRSRNGVARYAQKWRFSTRTTYTAGELSALFGYADHTVVGRWIRYGWITATNTGTDTWPRYHVTDDSLEAFLLRPDLAMLWQPSQITDAGLRAWAADVYAGHPHWLSVNEVAVRLHLSPSRVTARIRAGRLSAVRRWQWWIEAGVL